MAESYVTATVKPLTGPNVHPDDTTLLAIINGITVWSFGNEDHLNDFVNARSGRIGYDNGERVITVTTTPKEYEKIQKAGMYKS